MSQGSCFSLQFLILITASSDLFTDVLLILLLKRKAVWPFLSYPPSLFFSHSSYTSTETGSSCLLSPRPESNLEFLSTRWTLVYKGQTLSKKNTEQKASPLAGSKCSQKTFRYCILVRVSAYLIDGVCIEVFSLGHCVTISTSPPSSWNPLCINQGDRWSCLSCPQVLLLHLFSLKRRDDRSS